MMLHDGPAVLHCVMFAVVFFVLKGGEGLQYGLHNRARGIITVCPRAKICLTQTPHFYKVSIAL